MTFEDRDGALEGTGTITAKGNFDTLPESWGGRNIEVPRSAARWRSPMPPRWLK